jgi:hypothetical protein
VWIIVGGITLVFFIASMTMFTIWLTASLDDGGDDGEEEDG